MINLFNTFYFIIKLSKYIHGWMNYLNFYVIPMLDYRDQVIFFYQTLKKFLSKLIQID
jgi:hypothetical protein